MAGLLTWRRPAVQLRLDGSTQWETVEQLTLAIAANGSYFGRGMHIAPGADASDGLLQVGTHGKHKGCRAAMCARARGRADPAGGLGAALPRLHPLAPAWEAPVLT